MSVAGGGGALLRKAGAGDKFPNSKHLQPPHLTMSIAACVASLTDEQRHAVTSDPATPLQILAGPGSGKTRVLTSRVAWLVSGGAGRPIPPPNCVVVTFTNRAASEMRRRLEDLIGAQTSQLVLGTFHAICMRLLRRHGARIGIPANFTIADRDSA